MKSYEDALQVNAEFVPAMNNLAWLYAEHGGNIDRALSLAEDAKRLRPDDPRITDTLGWIYYKKNIFTRAAVYLREAAEKLGDNPVVHYHLGMAL
ncbi:MAG: hypothetical protein BZ151_13495, partial [Desulfobacca sp. 4484_104]